LTVTDGAALEVDYHAQWTGHDFAASEAELRQILAAASGRKGGQYDCLVPLSGGKDSTYVLYLCARVYGLKVLAMNFDNGFQSPLARENRAG
jgi:tRNA(Ile)-lysidine synthase TilS/MesJ